VWFDLLRALWAAAVVVRSSPVAHRLARSKSVSRLSQFSWLSGHAARAI